MNITPNGFANPLDIKKKETELDTKEDLELKYELDDDHIYDDPNHLVHQESCLKLPLPPTMPAYNTLNRNIDAKAPSRVNAPTPYMEPSTGASGKGEGANSSESEGRYTYLHHVSTSNSSLTTANGTRKSKPPVPPGYAAPRSSLVPQTPVPPGYAVPRPQSMEKVENLPPAAIDPAKDGPETVGYFPLMRIEKENSAYQPLKPAQQDHTASHTQQEAMTSNGVTNPTQQDVPKIEEEEEYMEMKSPQSKTPEFPE